MRGRGDLELLKKFSGQAHCRRGSREFFYAHHHHLSSASGSGQELAEAVADILGYRCVGRTELLERAGVIEFPKRTQPDLGKRSALVGAVAAKHASLSHRLQGASVKLPPRKDRYHGHLGHDCCPASGFAESAAYAPLEVRIDQLKSRENLAQVRRAVTIEEIDKARSAAHVDVRHGLADPSRYDLVLNLGQITESAKRLIVEAAKREEYQPRFFRAQFQDSFTQHQSHAVLITSQEFRGSI